MPQITLVTFMDGSHYLAVQMHPRSSTAYYPAVMISSDKIQPFAFPVIDHIGLLDAKMKYGIFSYLSAQQRSALSLHNIRHYQDSPLVKEKRERGEKLVPILEAICEEICQMDKLGVAYPNK